MTTNQADGYNNHNVERDTLAEQMVNDMVSWLRQHGKKVTLSENGQIRFLWERGSRVVKVSYVNSEDIRR